MHPRLDNPNFIIRTFIAHFHEIDKEINRVRLAIKFIKLFAQGDDISSEYVTLNWDLPFHDNGKVFRRV